jgi:hypothetical protein
MVKWWPIERSRRGEKVRRRWCSYVGYGYDEQRVWVERGPRLMLYFFFRNWRVLTFQEEGKRLLSYYSDETCNGSWKGEGYLIIGSSGVRSVG